jgi:hypothetical protein
MAYSWIPIEGAYLVVEKAIHIKWKTNFLKGVKKWQ